MFSIQFERKVARRERPIKRLERQHRKIFGKRNPDLFDGIRPGDRVTIVNRFGQERTGRATIINRKDDVVVLNMGGPHGTPGIATRDNVVKVVPGKKGQRGGFIFNPRRRTAKRARRNYFGVLGKRGYSERATWILVKKEVERIRRMNGYREGGDVWLGPSLHRIEDIAVSMLRQLAAGIHENPLLGVFGANPRAKIVRELGRVVEVRYKRKDDGGLYYHKYTSKPRLLALSDGSIWIKGA
jgi:hypothetical protein